jgi:hypothetical protein
VSDAGYSGTPLAKKLGLKPGMRAWFLDMPDSVRAEIGCDTLGLNEQAAPSPGIEAAHIFVTRRTDLAREVEAIRRLLAPTGFVWIPWPKKAAKTDTDITENIIREVALPTGLVDIKVCAVDGIWSGLKLVIRKSLRTA